MFNILQFIFATTTLFWVSGIPIEVDESKCLTTTGAAPNKPCIFPFIHEGVEYNECISYEHGEHWCSTKVNETGHHLTGNYFWGNCGQNCPHTTAMARLDKCLNKDMMPYYGSEECYPLFEQGPCAENEWFVLDSKLKDTVLPYAHCETALDCEVFTLENEHEGAECIPCDNLVFDENEDYVGCDVINSPGSNEPELGIRDLIGGFNVCGKNQAKDTRGNCKPAYKLSSQKDKNKDVSRSERENKRQRPKNLRKYLQSRHRF